MEQLKTEDLQLINNLTSRKYERTSLRSKATAFEHDRFTATKTKLGTIANFFSQKYSNLYGPFATNVSPEANPVTLGNTLNYVWSTLFKGAPNKQYAAQISFVIDKIKPCLNVGFYFGSASARSLNDTQRVQFENMLTDLGVSVSTAIKNNEEIQQKYNSLFDMGFTCYIGDEVVLPSNWPARIQTESKNSKIVAKIYPNELGIIESSTIDFYVSQLIFLMATINPTEGKIVVVPLTPEQWAKQAERNAQIGFEGEKYIMTCETNKLKALGINNNDYPRHIALQSSHYGYDVLSLDDNGKEIYIEVKTTTRKKEDPGSKTIFMSSNEFNVYSQNLGKYRLYRVYDIEHNPSFEHWEVNSLEKEIDGYIMKRLIL